MPYFKATHLFQMTTNTAAQLSAVQRTAGWSESWYWSGTLPALRAQFLALAQLRANLLPVGASIIGARYSQVADPVGPFVPGPSTSESYQFPGGPLATDVPQMGLLCGFTSSDGNNRRPFILRCVPDARVVVGEYQPSASYNASLRAYFAMCAQFFRFRARLRTEPILPFVSVDSHGLATFASPHPYGVGNYLRAYRVLDVFQRPIKGLFPIASVPAPNQVQFGYWPPVDSKQGSFRRNGFLYQTCTAPSVAGCRVVQRKVGRPFAAFHGRAPIRR